MTSLNEAYDAGRKFTEEAVNLELEAYNNVVKGKDSSYLKNERNAGEVAKGIEEYFMNKFGKKGKDGKTEKLDAVSWERKRRELGLLSLPERSKILEQYGFGTEKEVRNILRHFYSQRNQEHMTRVQAYLNGLFDYKNLGDANKNAQKIGDEITKALAPFGLNLEFKVYPTDTPGDMVEKLVQIRKKIDNTLEGIVDEEVRLRKAA